MIPLDVQLDVQHGLPGVPVEALLQALLIERMANEADRPGQHEEAVQVADLDDLLDLRLAHDITGSWLCHLLCVHYYQSICMR